MATNPALTDPAYKFSLAGDGLMVIGRICVIWAHIEIIIETLIQHCHQIDRLQFDQFFGDKQVGHKIGALKKAAKRLSHPNSSADIINLCNLLEPLATKRNHVVHGMWGWTPQRRTKKMVVAAHSQKRPKNPFKAEDLIPLQNEIAEASCIADELFSRLLATPRRPVGGRQFFFGEGDPPDWFEGSEKLLDLNSGGTPHSKAGE